MSNKIRYKMKSSLFSKRGHMKVLKEFKTVYQISSEKTKSGVLTIYFSLKNKSEQKEIENRLSSELGIKLERI